MMERILSADQLDRKQAILIYGAGTAGRTLRRLLEDEGITVRAFVDSHRSGTQDGLPVLHVNEVAKGETGPIVICSCHVNDIREACRRHGLENLRDGYPLYALYARTGYRLRFSPRIDEVVPNEPSRNQHGAG